MQDLEQVKQQIKEKQQKIIEENLKNLSEHKLAVKKQQEQAYQQLLNKDDTEKEHPFGILFPSIIVVGTLLIIAGFVSVICLLISMF